MTPWETLLARPADLADGPGAAAWFTRIADQLLNGCDLLVNGHRHRFVEVEIYYHGEAHTDPFAHRDPVQLHCGRWYFHRTGGVYRGGSFKGLDLAFGDGTAHAGALIRGIEASDGTMIDGPSLTVDRLLSLTDTKTVAELDREVGVRQAWNPTSPLALIPAVPARTQEPLRCPRVGLSLKRTGSGLLPTTYIGRHYRFLSEPKKTSKGKVHMVLGLHAQGVPAADIATRTGCPRKNVDRYIADFEAGKQLPDFSDFGGKDLSTTDLCRLMGACHALRSGA